jgi:hypothetical protein
MMYKIKDVVNMMNPKNVRTLKRVKNVRTLKRVKKREMHINSNFKYYDILILMKKSI